MLFWKSMPITDAKILTSKTLSGLLLFVREILLRMNGVRAICVKRKGTDVQPRIREHRRSDNALELLEAVDRVTSRGRPIFCVSGFTRGVGLRSGS